MKEEKVEVKCPKCNHIFMTISKNLVSCNECGNKFKKSENLTKTNYKK
jgi:ribosomal protein S27E